MFWSTCEAFYKIRQKSYQSPTTQKSEARCRTESPTLPIESTRYFDSRNIWMLMYRGNVCTPLDNIYIPSQSLTLPERYIIYLNSIYLNPGTDSWILSKKTQSEPTKSVTHFTHRLQDVRTISLWHVAASALADRVRFDACPCSTNIVKCTTHIKTLRYI